MQHSFCITYVVAKATTHKDFAALTHNLKPSIFMGLNVAAEAMTHKDYSKKSIY